MKNYFTGKRLSLKSCRKKKGTCVKNSVSKKTKKKTIGRQNEIFRKEFQRILDFQKKEV